MTMYVNKLATVFQRVTLTMNKPIIFGVLTTSIAEQAFARAGG